MELSDLDARLSVIESRLCIIERSLGFSSPPHVTARPASLTPAQTVHQETTESSREEKPGNWLGIIAVICFILAAGFIIKLSIESGWLTPERQVCLAILFGLSLVGTGFALLKSDHEYASLLPASGVIVLYITAFAAYQYYSLVSFEIAIAMVSFVSGLCIWLYTQIRHGIYPVTAAVGAYISPVILGLNTTAVFSIYYFLLCSFAFATISIWLQSRTLTMVSAYLAILMTSFIGFDLQQDEFIASMLALHFIILSTGTYLYTTSNRQPLTVAESYSYLPVLLVFYAMEYYFIERISPNLAPWISLGFAGLLIGFYLSAKKYFPDNLASKSLILSFTTIVCFHSIYLELLPPGIHPWLFVFIMLGGAFFCTNVHMKKYGRAFSVPVIAVLAIMAIEYINMAGHLLEEDNLSWLAVSFASIMSIWYAFLVTVGTAPKTYGHALLGSAHILAVLGFYRLTNDYNSLAVSASWLLYAVSVIAFAFIRKDGIMAKSALFVLGLAAGKALLYDAASAPTIIRILCLLLTGAVLYGCGFIMRRISNWAANSK